MPAPDKEETEFPDTLLSLKSFLFILLATGIGIILAMVVLPSWLPKMADSMAGPDPKAFWYLSRGSGFVALSLLWGSMALGILMTNKMARNWPGVPAAFAIHEFISLLGIGFSMFHALVLIGDQYIKYEISQIIIPFMSSYEPIWVGLGQVGFYVMLILTLSFYVRKKIGQKLWRVIHYIGFANYVLALIHGLTSGSDTELPWAQQYYWVSGGILLFLVMYRIVSLAYAKAGAAPTRVTNQS